MEDEIDKAIKTAAKIRSAPLTECFSCHTDKVADEDFTDDLSRREFRISQLCQKCQDVAFAEPPVDDDEPNLSLRVHELLMKCFYQTPLSNAPVDAVLVDGIVHKYGFDPKLISENKAKIEALIDEIVPEAFYVDAGGGMSFLSLAESKTGEQWAEHREVEALYALAAAIGRARFCMPRELWPMLPGGMPYIQFDRSVVHSPA